MRERFVRALGAAFVAFFLLAPRYAAAYPWMIRHDYNVCSVCHTDPSGGNLLTEYGRSLSQTLLSSELLAKRDEEPGKFKDFAFGLVPLPENVQAGAFLRSGYIANYRDGALVDDRTLRMRADLEAHAQFGAVRIDGQLGVLPGASANLGREAQLNRATGDDLAVVARTYWAGYELNDGDALVRAGRLYMPFGLRNIEHNSWVRSATKTDINQHQQHGVSYYWTNGAYRAEVMAVLGNYQLRPDAFRERGIVAYLERRISGKQALAVQMQALRSSSDALTLSNGSLTRQAYGATYRLAPHERVALMAEANVLVNTFAASGTEFGHVAFLQADVEPLNGFHVMATVEELKQALANQDQRFGAWLSSAYFPVPHTELRVDGIYRTNGSEPASLTLLFQGQLYL
jgi:hypothetical protein